MHNHFDKHLGLKDIILGLRPRKVIECGAGGGENTLQLLDMRREVPFHLTVITDGRFEDSLLRERKDIPDFLWIFGLSYKELPKLQLDSVDLCIIDTDHNYWTLDAELKATDGILRKKGVIAMHDTTTYNHNSGVGTSYVCGESYPNVIHEVHHAGKHMGDALREFMAARPEYRILAKSEESHGAMAIQKL